MIIDIYTHIYPNAYYETMNRVSPQLENLGKRMRQVTKLHDLDERFREMDNYGDYRQVISLPQPPIEDVSNLPRLPSEVVVKLDLVEADLCDGLQSALEVLLHQRPDCVELKADPVE